MSTIETPFGIFLCSSSFVNVKCQVQMLVSPACVRRIDGQTGRLECRSLVSAFWIPKKVKEHHVCTYGLFVNLQLKESLRVKHDRCVMEFVSKCSQTTIIYVQSCFQAVGTPTHFVCGCPFSMQKTLKSKFSLEILLL